MFLTSTYDSYQEPQDQHSTLHKRGASRGRISLHIYHNLCSILTGTGAAEKDVQVLDRPSPPPHQDLPPRPRLSDKTPSLGKTWLAIRGQHGSSRCKIRSWSEESGTMAG